METKLNEHEYSYSSSESGHHHSYLLPPLLELLSTTDSSSQPNIHILDIGCGNGSLTNSIAKHGYKVVGVEESESGFEFARQSFPNCKFIQDSLYNLPYKELEHSFDIVISCEVIEHLFYPRELVRVAKKCLKPNGMLILTTPYHGYLKNIAIAVSGRMDKHFSTLLDGGHIKFFSVATMKQLLQEEEFTNLQFKFAGRIPYLWKSMLCSASLT